MRKKLTYLIPPFFLFYVYDGLGKENINVDQFLWYQRTNNFFQALFQGNFSETYQKYHPGVLLMYLIRFGTSTYKIITGDSSSFEFISYDKFHIFNFWTKFYLISFIVLALVLSAFFLYKITANKVTSILFLTILLLEPFFIGNLRNLHMDALVGVLIISTLLSFLAGLKKRKLVYFIASGFLSGLGLLTKSLSFSVIGLNFMIVAYFFIFKPKDRLWLIKIFALFLGVSLGTFILFFPAMWVRPIHTVKKIIVEGVIKTGLEGKDSFDHFVNGMQISDPGPTFYIRIFKYRFTLLLQLFSLSFFPLAIYNAFRIGKDKLKKKLIRPESYSFMLLFFSLIYIIGYFIVFTYSDKKTDRYLTTLFPFFTILASHSFVYLHKILKVKFLEIIFASLFLLLVVVNLIHLSMIHPYHFAYYNPVWGGLEKARDEIYLNQGGIGTYEIAQFLNSHDISESDLIGATNFNELNYFSKHPVEGFSNDQRDDYDFVVLTMQRDRQFKQDRKTIKLIKIFGNDYLRVSEKAD